MSDDCDLATEIIRLWAELEAGHGRMDRAGIPRRGESGPLSLAARIDLQLEAHACALRVANQRAARLLLEAKTASGTTGGDEEPAT